MQTLILNYSFEPVQIVSWEKAVYLLFVGKADIVETYDKVIRSVSTSMALPKIIRLKRYIRIKLKKIGAFKKDRVFDRDNWKCQYCGDSVTRKTATIDHILAKSLGGPTTFENVTTACLKCNQKKRNLSLKEAGMSLLSKPAAPKEHGHVNGSMSLNFSEYLKSFK